jgi:hypothetical protein
MNNRVKKNHILEKFFRMDCFKLEEKRKRAKFDVSCYPVGFSFSEFSSAKVGWSISLVLILGFPSFA